MGFKVKEKTQTWWAVKVDGTWKDFARRANVIKISYPKELWKHTLVFLFVWQIFNQSFTLTFSASFYLINSSILCMETLPLIHAQHCTVNRLNKVLTYSPHYLQTLNTYSRSSFNWRTLSSQISFRDFFIPSWLMHRRASKWADLNKSNLKKKIIFCRGN